MTYQQATGIVFDELNRAQVKHPAWPEDVVHGAAVVAEEAGELIQAALDRFYGRTDNGAQLIKEAVHTAAMALRFLFNLHKTKGGNFK